MRYAARVGYMGTNYSGWQRQAMGTGVQEKIEESLAALEGKPVTVTAAQLAPDDAERLTRVLDERRGA